MSVTAARTEIKDVLGQKTEVGDLVVTIGYFKSGPLKLGEVIKITPKKVRVKFARTNPKYDDTHIVLRDDSQVIKIDPIQAGL